MFFYVYKYKYIIQQCKILREKISWAVRELQNSHDVAQLGSLAGFIEQCAGAVMALEQMDKLVEDI